MKVKYIRNNTQYHSITLEKTYDVLSFYMGKGTLGEYNLICDDSSEDFVSLGLYDASYFEIVFDSIPPEWGLQFNPYSGFVLQPKSWMKEGFWEEFYDDDEPLPLKLCKKEPSSLELYKKEVSRIKAFNSQLTMKGFFASQLLEKMQQAYDPFEICSWAKTYNKKDLSVSFYDAPLEKEIEDMLVNLTLVEWNSELATSEEQLRATLEKWMNEKIIKDPT
jgi:hypothetical protein